MKKNSLKPFNKISFKRYLSVNWKTFKLFSKKNNRLLITIFFFDISCAIIPALQIWIGKLVIDNLIIFITSNNLEKFPSNIIIYAIFELILGLCLNLFASYSKYNRFSFFLENELNIREIFLKKCNQLSLEYFEDHKNHDLIGIIEKQVLSNTSKIIQSYLDIIPSVLRLISLCLLLGYLNPFIVILLLIINITSILFNKKIIHSKYRINKILEKFHRKNKYINSLFINTKRLYEIKLLRSGNYLRSIFSLNQSRINKNLLWPKKKQVQAQRALAIIDNMAYYGFYLFSIVGVLQKKFTVGDLGLYQRSYRFFGQTLKRTVDILINLFEHSLYMELYHSFISISIENKMSFIPLETKIVEIKFDKVSFNYPCSDLQVLKNINFSIKAGEIVSIVGTNGAGKSSILKLLTGLYRPSSGKIYINNNPIDQYAIDQYLNKIAVVIQKPESFELTFKENLLLEKTDSLQGKKQLMGIIDKFKLKEIVDKLPNGVNSYLSKRFKGGQVFSGGEWKKINIARALKNDGDIVILDEPLTNMDTFYQEFLISEIKKMKEDKKIVIIVSHNSIFREISNKKIVINNGLIKTIGPKN